MLVLYLVAFSIPQSAARTIPTTASPIAGQTNMVH